MFLKSSPIKRFILQGDNNGAMIRCLQKRSYIEIVLAFFLLALIHSNSQEEVFSPFLLLFVVFIIGFFARKNEKKTNSITENRITFGFTTIMSILFWLSNYSIWTNLDRLTTDNDLGHYRVFFILIQSIIFYLGGWVVWKEIFLFALSFVHRDDSLCSKKYSKPIYGLLSFLGVLCTDLVFLICKYPGVLTYDSIAQIDQLVSNNYTNHHPFYHTILVKLFVSIGLRLFGNYNAAMALYLVFQIVVSALSFSYLITTLVELEVNKYMVVGLIIFHILMPYNIMFSITVWKDIIFSNMFMVFLVSVYRIFNGIGNKVFSGLLFILSGVILCLYRSNGYFVLILFFVLCVILFIKKYPFICIITAVVLIFGFVLKHPVIKCFGVTQPDIVESLSIPIQQVSRVVIETDDIDTRQKELISDVIDIETIKEEYKPYISDPIKGSIRDKGNIDALKSREYAELYFKLGVSHPVIYLKAWIDQTRGFWNAGYYYWVWDDIIRENNYGIHRVNRFKKLDNVLNIYLMWCDRTDFFRLFLSIGLYFWVVIILCFVSIIKKDGVSLLLNMSIIFLFLSLFVATPVAYEFRYAYAYFTCIPFLTIISLFIPLKDNCKEG